MTTPAQHDFNDGIVRLTEHRPWPLPTSAWVMTQSWHDLLFAHWPVDADVLRARVPSQFPLDLYEGQAWLGIVPFRMTNVAPRFVPALPWISAFPELNVRTYVTVGNKPGVYFFSLDAGNSVAVGAARTLAHLPYYSASMSVEESHGWIEYRSRRTTPEAVRADLKCRYRPKGGVLAPAPGTLEHFLTERYCLYTTDKAGHAYRLEIHHPAWPLQQAQAEFTINTMAEASGIALPDVTPLLHFAKRQDMVAWPLDRLALP
jgi:uncharacterized protein YqjF (DUF2071 family)